MPRLDQRNCGNTISKRLRRPFRVNYPWVQQDPFLWMRINSAVRCLPAVTKTSICYVELANRCVCYSVPLAASALSKLADRCVRYSIANIHKTGIVVPKGSCGRWYMQCNFIRMLERWNLRAATHYSNLWQSTTRSVTLRVMLLE